MSTTATRTVRHRIGGEETTGSSTRTSIVWDPATGQPQAEVVLAETADVDAAVAAAKAAFPSWSETSISRRAKIMFAFRNLLEAHTDELARIIASEHGKVVEDAKGEIMRGMEVAEFACGIPQLLKGEYCDKISSDVDALLDHPDVAAISFVGSTPIAKYIHERGTANGKRIQALGGAKNHAIVLPDAGIDYTSDHLVAAAFGSAGERCMAISAAVAVGGAADDLIAAVSEKARAVKVGPGREADSEMGPVVTSAARDRIRSLIGSGEEQGAKLVVDGRGLTVPGHDNGYWVGPTVIDEVTTSMDVYKEEIF